MRMRLSPPTLLGQAELPGPPPATSLAQLRRHDGEKGLGDFQLQTGGVHA